MVLGASSAWAQTATYGITRTITDNKLSDDIDVNANVEGITFSTAYGTQDALTDKDRTIYHGSSTKLTVPKGIKNYRNKLSGTDVLAFNENCYYSFVLSIDKGKQITIKTINGDVCTDGDGFVYRMTVVNNGETVYTCNDMTLSKSSSAGAKSVDCTTGDEKFAKLLGMTGTVQVYMYWWNGSSKTGKYLDIKDFNVEIEVEEAAAQTQYTKPAITVGAYDQPSGTYAVTLAVQNDEDGTINYTIGEGEKVTEVTSGTIVNVPYSTTIVATVSGDTYDESEETSVTMAGKPQLAAPTYKIGGFDFATQLYSVTLSATEGAKIYYTTDDWATYPEYTGEFTVAPETTVKAQAQQNNMTTSADLVFVTPAAPQDGTHTTPTDGSVVYTDGMTYNAGAYTIPGTPNYIGAAIASGNSSINGSIKMRFSRSAEPTLFPSSRGFHIDVNPGYTITSVTLKALNNYTGDKANAHIAGVYVDDATTENLLAENVALPKASAKTVEPAVVTIDGIAATKRIVFVVEKDAEGDDEPNQGQVILSVKYLVPVYNTSVTPDGYGTMYYEKELVCPEGTEAYTGELSEDKTVLALTKLDDGIIPANTPVVIKGEGGLFTVGNTAAAAVESSLEGTATAIETSSVEGTVCVLGYVDGKAGFYKYTGVNLGANKAYLVVPAASAPKIRIVIDDEVNGINNVNNVVVNNGLRYNINGQRVADDYKGIVIINGKKTLVK